MMYDIDFTDNAVNDIAILKRSEPKAYKKLLTLLTELHFHPRTGTGKPEPLSNNKTGQWSRRISKKHRLIYMIDDKKVIVLLLSAHGHYDDK